MLKKINIFFAIVCILFKVHGQNTIGLPEVVNFNKEDYYAGLQNWDIAQDKNGILYFANNEGVLSFDGFYWNLFSLPNKTIVRSVEIGFDNKLYAGGQDELGYFAPTLNGKLQYVSLTSLIPQKDRNFGDVWDIISTSNEIFFRTPQKIFRYSGNEFNVYKSPSEWSFLGFSAGRILAHDYEKGLMELKNGSWSPIQTINPLAHNDPITSLIQLTDGTFFTTLKNGLFKLNGNIISKIDGDALQKISEERIYSSVSIDSDRIALATNDGGLYIINSKGKLIQKFSKKDGLQNNNILDVFLDAQLNLWLGLDNGIDCVAYNSSIKKIRPNNQDASGYASIIHNKELYIGTSSGLFYTALDNSTDLSFCKGDFTEVNNTKGQVWGLSEINNSLFLGHHEGAFIIKDHQSLPLMAGDGYWNFAPLSNVLPASEIVAGTYKGLNFFEADRDLFKWKGILPDFEESSRYLVMDNEYNIWVSHPYHGVFKISKVDDNRYQSKPYGLSQGLPNMLNNQVFKIKNKIVIASETGVFSYNNQKDRFERDPFFSKILGSQSIRYLKEDNDGNIWFIHEKNPGVILNYGKEPQLLFLTELNRKILSGFEFIYSVNKNNVFIGGEKGFYHINLEKYSQQKADYHLLIRSVKINNQKDSLLYGGYFKDINHSTIQTEGKSQKISNDWRNIHFEYAATIYGKMSPPEYSFLLKDFDKGWSAWTTKTEKDYTNLPPGHYVFMVKVRTPQGTDSTPVVYDFTILPPWYMTLWAYFFYFMAGFCLLYVFYARQRKKLAVQQLKFEEEKKNTNYHHQLEIEKAEAALISLRNEKLQSEIDFKNSELATNAMHLVQKGELLNKIKAELNNIMKGMDNEKVSSEIKKMIKVLSEDEKMDKDWEHFAQHFDKVNSDFVAIVKSRHPEVTPNELKLCTYLRMNLSSKEIAQLMNISVRGIEISRYRLRKKLGIPTEITLFDYLIGLSK